jgi:hypothetical protein
MRVRLYNGEQVVETGLSLRAVEYMSSGAASIVLVEVENSGCGNKIYMSFLTPTTFFDMELSNMDCLSPVIFRLVLLKSMVMIGHKPPRCDSTGSVRGGK